jgi:NADH dehydrogenase
MFWQVFKVREAFTCQKLSAERALDPLRRSCHIQMKPNTESPMRARIYQPARTAMSSGTAKTKNWVLEFAPSEAREVDPLMGWTSSADTQSQVKLQFATKQEAVDYAAEHGIDVQVQDPNKRKPVIRNGGYGENFATGRRGAWTH